jgi:hypothetical protein
MFYRIDPPTTAFEVIWVGFLCFLQLASNGVYTRETGIEYDQ